MFEALHKSKQISVIALDRLGDYFELLRIELKMQGQEIVLRLMAYVVAALFTVLAALFVGVAVILSFLDTPYRTLAAWVVVALYLAGAGFGIYLARKRILKEPAFAILREELKRDVAMVKESL
jgi:uncharacterized membrane protein YqjE